MGQDEADIKKNLIFFKSPIGKALIGKNKSDMIMVILHLEKEILKF